MITLGDFQSTKAIEDSVIKVLRSGRLTYGPVQKEFEAKFAALHGCSHAVITNSGTSSLQIAIQAMKSLYGWKDGDEVIVPALTFVATVNAVLHNNLKPVLVDVDPQYYFINTIPRVGTSCVEEKITERTRLIIPVHPFGLPAEMEFIEGIAEEHKLMVLEDSCESMFVSREGKSVGSWGDAAAFSMYAAHILVSGVGGVTTVKNNYDLAEKCRSLANHGIALSELPTGEEYDPSWMARNFLFDEVGHSFRLTEMEGAVALEQLKSWDVILNSRQNNAHKITENLKDLEDAGHIQLPSTPYNSDHAWMVYPIVMLNETKHKIRHYLKKKEAAETRSLLPLITQPCYDFINPEEYPTTLNINRNGFYVGCHQYVTDEQINHFSEVMHEFFK